MGYGSFRQALVEGRRLAPGDRRDVLGGVSRFAEKSSGFFRTLDVYVKPSQAAEKLSPRRLTWNMIHRNHYDGDGVWDAWIRSGDGLAV
ncbi:hypothetical protein, partial [Salipiger bermudensis]|uniref:hypothetical protein n=1 Tax=Salipiger bermudensis TaxID=344736 RepID=UPI001A8F8FC5